LEGAVEPAVAALTLVQGVVEEGRARDLFQQTQKLSGLPSDLFESLLNLLKTLYGSAESGRFLHPLQPDLLGEQLVAERLGKDSDWLSKVIVGANLDERLAVLAVLVRLAQRRPEARLWLEGALQSHLEELAEAAVLATVVAGDLVGKILVETLSEHPSVDIARAVMDLCDQVELQTSAHLLEVAFVATEKILRAASLHGDTSEQERKEVAKILNNLGYRLSSLGRREEALRATEEAIVILRLLATQKPDTFLPDLARALNNLGKMLRELGQREEALRATEEAVDILRQFATQRPEDFLPDLAKSLNTLGSILSGLSQWEEALNTTEEAVGVFRQLATQRPGAFLPELAASVNNLGNRLSALGRREESLQAFGEAVNIRLQLAKQRPDAFLPDLAMSLNNLGNSFRNLGQNEEALRVKEEAIRTLSPFFVRYPDAFFPWMKTFVRTYLKLLTELGREPDEQLLSPIVALLSERLAPPNSTSSG